MFEIHKKPKYGYIYACETGTYAGQMLIYMDSNASEHAFLAIPTMENHWIPKDEFDFAVDHDIVNFVKRAPKHVKKTSKFKFEENKQVVRSID